jgi:hypothetical protein
MRRARALDPGFDLAEERLHTPLENDTDIEHWIEGLRRADDARERGG